MLEIQHMSQGTRIKTSDKYVATIINTSKAAQTGKETVSGNRSLAFDLPGRL